MIKVTVSCDPAGYPIEKEVRVFGILVYKRLQGRIAR
jgi:hypothetical protein